MTPIPVLVLSTVAVTLALTVATAAQAPPALAFDVASVRSAPSLQEQLASGQLRVSSTIAETRVDLKGLSMADLVTLAYRIKPYQLTGPGWLQTERYDVQATYPDGVTKEQVPEMMQALLAERFNLKIRRARKPHDVYELVVDKNGHTLKPATAEATTLAPAGPGEQTLNLGGQEVRMGADGRSATVASAEGAARVTQTESGGIRMDLDRMTLPRFADMLTSFAGRPVVDATGLAGMFQIPLELRQEDIMFMARAAAQTAGVTLPPALSGGATPGQAADPDTSSVFNAVRKLGLRLESRSLPIDVIVVESADKVPVEN